MMNGSEDEAVRFLDRVLPILKIEGVLEPSVDRTVVDFLHPKQLEELLSLDMSPSSGNTADGLERACREIVRHSVRTGHPHFHNQLYAGADHYGLAGAWITEALNTNQFTYEVAPAFTLVEQAVLRQALKLFGFASGPNKTTSSSLTNGGGAASITNGVVASDAANGGRYQDGGGGGDGIFCPGGSLSNMYAMTLARHRAVPSAKTKGLAACPTLVAFTSKDSHYSMKKSVNWLGIGTDNLVQVGTDASGRMCPRELAASIVSARAAGKLPFFVNATAGTTVLGAFDPLPEIADVCRDHAVWLHVDACWGGSLILSEAHSHLLSGTERVDSLSWNPHKMLGAPLQCSMLLVKEKGLLHQCNSASAAYLFQQDKFYDVSYDTGDKSVQCGRKVDAFKLWLMWRARGDEGLRELVDNAMECSRYLTRRIRNRPGFRLVMQEYQCTNVCFWYIPPSMRDGPETAEWWEALSRVAPIIKHRLVACGTLMIGYTPLPHRPVNAAGAAAAMRSHSANGNGQGGVSSTDNDASTSGAEDCGTSQHCVNFFRFVNTCQPPPTYAGMDHVYLEIERVAADM